MFVLVCLNVLVCVADILTIEFMLSFLTTVVSVNSTYDYSYILSHCLNLFLYILVASFFLIQKIIKQYKLILHYN